MKIVSRKGAQPLNSIPETANDGHERVPLTVLRVMSFNLRHGTADDGPNSWIHRKSFVIDIIRQFSPDILGLQEALHSQLEELIPGLPQYGRCGVGREGGSRGEYCAILYRRKRLDLKASETFWLSETPAIPSVSWHSNCPRICTVGLFALRQSGRTLRVYNTHLDNHSQEAREKGMQVIIRHMTGQHPEGPLILLGDFNVEADNALFSLLKEKTDVAASPVPELADTFRVCHPTEHAAGTFHAFTGRDDGPRIDYIFVNRQIRPVGAGILRMNRNGHYPSDHFPIVAELSLD
ncbi:MAG: endonuclease/exonuclease/phosphatase family protein [Lentisphaerae bacterium]|nr:MAG: endonuclease/exonuclease/phosphatase family protein [Lentisphaerota bacterium]